MRSYFSSSTIKRTPCRLHRRHHGDPYVENVDSQEGENEKYQGLSGWLIHGMQPSDDDDLQHVSVKSILLSS